MGKIGKGTKVWDEKGLWGDHEIGEDCVIGKFVEIGDGVRIGDRCKIEAFAFIPPGVVIEDEVFIGPHACFTNDKYPATGEDSGQRHASERQPVPEETAGKVLK